MPKAAKAKSSATPAPRSVPYFRPSAAWPPAADEMLLSAYAKGMSFKQISENCITDKSETACRKHYKRLIDRRIAQSWDGIKLGRLAAEYMNLRSEIWKPLADAVGEKWQSVEAKCMENGFNSLRASARSAGWRSGGVSGTDEFFADDHDSGIAMEDEAEMDAGRRQSDRIAEASRTTARAPTPSKQQQLPTYSPHPASLSHLQLPPPISSPGYVRSPTHSDSTLTHRSVSNGPTIASLLSPSHPPSLGYK